MKYVVAVSGGVDSIVLLDMMAAKHDSKDLIIAHFDHGIRPDSTDDATFVRQVAGDYTVPFETKREELGVNASEELARDRRYAFLRTVAKKQGAKIMTAHHADDVVETIVINLTRGTGWRGLAVLDSVDIERPLLGMSKSDLIKYAHDHRLEWREDSTNTDTKYLRNSVRQKLTSLSDDDSKLLGLYRDRQVALKRLIDEESRKLIGNSPYSRHFFISIPEQTAVELLRMVFIHAGGESPTIPQRSRALHAIKTYAPGKTYEVARGVKLQFTRTTFVVDATPVVLS